MHWIRSYFNCRWQTKKLYQTVVSTFKTSPDPGCFLSRLLSPWLSGRVEERPLLWLTPQVTKSNGVLPEGGSAGKDLFWLPMGHPRSQEGRLHGVAPSPQDSGNQCSSQTKVYQFLPTEETQGQPANLEDTLGASGLFGRRGCWWQWRPGEQWSQRNWGSHRRVHDMLGKGYKRCPSRWKMLLPL